MKLALALHAAFDTAAGNGNELNCYCETWIDDNTPIYHPEPGVVCYELAKAILEALEAA